MDKITLVHGEGGSVSEELIQNHIKKQFNNVYLKQKLDSALIDVSKKIAFTTDSYVVKPLFFSGGDIGRLAVSGTVNDLMTVFSTPLFLSCSFIIEEGFEMKSFNRILKSMKETCLEANVEIVTGDTKVVPKGDADGLYINTSGIGMVDKNHVKPLEEGDTIIVSGSLALHGTVILVDRYQLKMDMSITSDCKPLNYLLEVINKYKDGINMMRDPTRGGLGTLLNEISTQNKVTIEINEETIPFHDEVKAVNELLGIDPLYVSSEGRMVFVVKSEIANEMVNDLKKLEDGENASIIGRIKNKNRDSIVYMNTKIGGKRIVGALDDLILPRIC